MQFIVLLRKFFHQKEQVCIRGSVPRKNGLPFRKIPLFSIVGREFFYTSFTIKRGNFSIFASLKLSIAGFNAAAESDGATD